MKYIYWLFYYYYYYFYFCRPPEHLQNGYVDEGYMSPRGRPPIQNGGMRQGKGNNLCSFTIYKAKARTIESLEWDGYFWF